ALSRLALALARSLQPISANSRSHKGDAMWQQIEAALRDSTRSVVLKLVIFLPGLLALFLAVALMAVLGVLLSFLLRRGLPAAKFDERLARSQNANVADWAPSHSPTVLAGRVVFWGCILFGLIVGISAFDTIFNPGTSEISLLIIPYLTHAVGAILVLVA